MLALALLLGAAFAWLAYEWANAPVGYQDAEGFHLGTEPFVPPSRRGESFGSHRSASPAAPHSGRAA